MPTPSSGPISAQDVGTEFSIPRPISFSSFYGKGGAPSSGSISLGNMYGRAAGPDFSPPAGSYSSDMGTSFTISSGSFPVVWTWTVSPGWPGAGANIPSGGSGTILTLKPPSKAASDRVLNYQVSAGGKSWSVSILTPGTISG